MSTLERRYVSECCGFLFDADAVVGLFCRMEVWWCGTVPGDVTLKHEGWDSL